MEKTLHASLGSHATVVGGIVQLSVDDGRIDFVVVCHTKRLTCPVCGAVDPPVHDRIERPWRHLNYFQFKAFIRAREGNQWQGINGAVRALGRHLVRVIWNLLKQDRDYEVRADPSATRT